MCVCWVRAGTPGLRGDLHRILNSTRSLCVCVCVLTLMTCVLQKLKEFLEGRNLITKLEAKHDLIQKTLGESKCVCVCAQ